MKKIRGGSGLGDSLYVRPVAEHYVRAGHQVTVMSNYHEVFTGAGVKVEPFTRLGTNVLAHYSSRKARTDSNQWEDVCCNAGVPGVPLSIKWEVKNHKMVNELKTEAGNRPIVMVNGGRPPMGRTDGYGREMLPDRAAFDSVLDNLKDCFTVEVGRGPEAYPLRTDLDMSEKTSVSDLMDIATIAGGLVGQCSFMIPLAEAFDKPLLVVWAAAGMKSETEYVRLCRPEKILSKPTSLWVVDDWTQTQITEVLNAYRQLLASR